MFRSKLLLLSILGFIILGSSYSFGQDKKVFKFKKDGPMKWEMKDDLNLSNDQEKQFEDFELQFEKKMIDLRAELEKSKLMKRELVRKGNFSKNDYLSAEEKIMQAENKIQMEKAKLKMEKYSLLDEKQKKSFIDRREHNFKFNFDMDGFKDGMRTLKENLRHIVPCPPDVDEIEKEIEVEIEDDEI